MRKFKMIILAIGLLFIPIKAGKALEFSRACEAGSKIIIGAVGDVLLHGALQAKGYRASAGFRSLWPSVEPYMKRADLTYANLESPTAKGVGPDGRSQADPGRRYDKNIYSGFPRFNAHPSVLSDLKKSGIDIVSTANNHAMDRGPLGVKRTIKALRAEKLAFSGTRTKKDAPYYTITKAKDWTIGWISCTYSTNGIADLKNQVLLCYDGRVSPLIQSLKNKVDAVIVTPHWGTEYSLTENDRQRRFAKKWLNAGAVAILGAHPHVPQRWEKITTKDGREGFVIYSLGNFIAAQLALPRKTSLLLYLGLTRNNGQVWINGVRYLPLYMQHFPHKVVPTGFPGERLEGHEQSLELLKQIYGFERLIKPGESILTDKGC